MSTDKYRDLLRDIVFEVNEIARDESIWEETEFYQGYRAGMMVVMKAIEDGIAAFGVSESIDLVSVNDWFAGRK